MSDDTMTFLIGSSFYNLNTTTSDKDYIQYLFPTANDLFKGSFWSVQSKDENENDINIKDIRLLLKELKKGSLQTFEILYSNPIENMDKGSNDFYNIYSSLLYSRDRLFEEQKGELLKAIRGELIGRYKKFNAENTVKGYVQCQKLIWLFYEICEGVNPFKLILDLDYTATDFLEYYKRLRTNCDKFKGIADHRNKLNILEHNINQIKNMAIENNKDKTTLELVEKKIFDEVFNMIELD